jgi:hypothetical protein
MPKFQLLVCTCSADEPFDRARADVVSAPFTVHWPIQAINHINDRLLPPYFVPFDRPTLERDDATRVVNVYYKHDATTHDLTDAATVARLNACRDAYLLDRLGSVNAAQ